MRKSVGVLSVALAIILQQGHAQKGSEWHPLVPGKDRGVSIRIPETSLNRTTIEFTVPGFFTHPVRVQDQSAVIISLLGGTSIMEKGSPDVPKVRRNIIVSDTALMKAQILSRKDTVLSFPLIAPSKGQLPRTVNPDTIPYVFGPFYQQDRWYPDSTIEMGEPFMLRDHRGVAVQFNPFQYNPVRKLLRVFTQLRVEVTASGADTRNRRNKARSGPQSLSPDYREVYDRRFLNFAKLGPRYPSVLESGRLLVVVADPLAGAIQDFVDWKTRKGLPTEVVGYPSGTGSGTTNLQQYIQNVYDSQQGLTYVILVGDNEQIPTRTGSSAQAAPSDPMYVKLAGDDDYPDAFISRVSATTISEAQNQLSKIIAYERFPDTGPFAAWYTRGTGIASDQGSPSDWQRCDELRDKLIAAGYSLVDQIYDPNATSARVTSALDGGRSIINYIGHGSDQSWVTTGFDNNDIDGLQSSNHLPFIIDVACMNGNFSGTGGDCFAEHWMKTGTADAPRGAIGIYASSRNADWVPPCIMQAEAVDLFVAGDISTLGGICYDGVMKGIDEYPGETGKKLMEQYNLFGDCTMEVRSKIPITMQVIHPPNAPTISSGFIVAVKQGTAMLPGARVTLTKDGQFVGSSLTAQDYPDKGTATFSFDLTPGPLTICVTQPNVIPYVGACQLETYAGELWVSLHGGATQPYDDWYESAFCFNSVVDLEYHWRLNWAVVVEFAYNDFKLVDPPTHFPWWNLTPTIRYYPKVGNIRFYFNGGPGIYIPKDGTAKVGVKLGGGVDFTISRSVRLEAGTDYHLIPAASGTNSVEDRRTGFQHFHAGLLLRLN
jgi:hypothetical protein